MSRDDLTEQWRCAECGHTETGPVDGVTGEPIKKTVGQGRRETTIETVLCPLCSSDNWHSESVRDAFLDP